MSSETSGARASGLGRLVGYLCLGAFFAVVWSLQSSGATLTLFSVEVPAWLVALALYLLGAVSMWGAGKTARRSS